jgi:hypothetical protein
LFFLFSDAQCAPLQLSGHVGATIGRPCEYWHQLSRENRFASAHIAEVRFVGVDELSGVLTALRVGADVGSGSCVVMLG